MPQDWRQSFNYLMIPTPTRLVLYMAHGIKLIDFYLSEAIRVKQSAVENKDLVLAENLLRWLKDEGLRTIYPVKVYQSGPSCIRSKAKALPILKLLESHGYLSPIAEDQSPLIDGAIRRQAWRVNAYSVDETLS